MPLVRVLFDGIWQVPDPLALNLANAAIESCVLAFYVPLVRRQGEQARQMHNAISAKDEAMEHLQPYPQRRDNPARTARIPRAGGGCGFRLSRGAVPPASSRRSPRPRSRSRSTASIERWRSRLALEETRARFSAEWPDGAELAEIRLAMVTDPYFAAECRRRVREERLDARGALIAEIRRLEQGFQSPDQSYLTARRADIHDLGQQILRHLADRAKDAQRSLASLPPGAVVVADELLLSDALQLDFHNVAAIVTDHTGPASHVAILARLKHIPSVCDIKEASSVVASGSIYWWMRSKAPSRSPRRRPRVCALPPVRHASARSIAATQTRSCPARPATESRSDCSEISPTRTKPLWSWSMD